MAGNCPDNPETVLVERNEVYRGKIVDLRVDTIRLASGRSAIREVIRHPGGVMAVPVRENGDLLLLRQYRYPLQKYILEFPAGKLDSRQSPLDTIRRELEEEAGHVAARWSHEFSFYTSPGISDELIHLFIARDLTPTAQKLEEGEHISVEFHSLEQCLQAVVSGDITDGKTLLGILWYRAKIL